MNTNIAEYSIVFNTFLAYFQARLPPFAVSIIFVIKWIDSIETSINTLSPAGLMLNA